MIFVHCTKSTNAIGQNPSRVFCLPGNNKSFAGWKMCIIPLKQSNQINFQTKLIKLIAALIAKMVGGHAFLVLMSFAIYILHDFKQLQRQTL